MKNTIKSNYPPFRLKRFVLVSCITISTVAAPIQAYALQSLVEIAATRLAELMQILAKEAALIAAWMFDKIQNLLATQSGTESWVAMSEKHLAGVKELTQAKLNYGATKISNDRYIDSLDRFTAESAQPGRVCEIAGDTFAATSENNTPGSTTQQTVTASVMDNLAEPNAAVTNKNFIDKYKTDYCDQPDVDSGLCKALSPDPEKRGAAVRASTLLSPAVNETYSVPEFDAVGDYVKMITNSSAMEALPRAFDNKESPQSAAFNIKFLGAQARLSMATYSLQTIVESRTADAELTPAMGELTSEAISAVGLMKLFVDSKHGDKDYQVKLAAMDETALLQEFTLQMAGKNWSEFMAYSQDERIESLISMRLGILAEERNRRLEELAREQAVQGMKVTD